MKIIKCIGKFIELSKWFNRKSQHYILGNWLVYTTDKNKRRDYLRRYPKAYIKFMWLSKKDWILFERLK